MVTLNEFNLEENDRCWGEKALGVALIEQEASSSFLLFSSLKLAGNPSTMHKNNDVDSEEM
jgi:hypothetical protein